MKVKLISRVRLLATPWTAAYQAPPSMGFSRQEYWSGVPLPSRSLITSKMQIQTIAGYHLAVDREAMVKNLQTRNAGEDVEKRDPSCAAGWRGHELVRAEWRVLRSL